MFWLVIHVWIADPGTARIQATRFRDIAACEEARTSAYRSLADYDMRSWGPRHKYAVGCVRG